MTLSLYKFENENIVANKIKGLSPVYTGDMTLYGNFNKEVYFRLSSLIDCNYCKYTFNNTDYYGYVKVETDSKGLYRYVVTIDPIATCWYAGCYNKNNFVAYEDSPSNNYLADNRVQLKPNVTIINHDMNDVFSKYYVVLTVLRPYDLVGVTQGYTLLSNPSFFQFAISVTQWRSFIQTINGEFNSGSINWDDTKRKQFVPSIISAYLVDSNYIENDASWGTVSNSGITLSFINQIQSSITQPSQSTTMVALIGDFYIKKNETLLGRDFLSKKTITINFTTDFNTIRANCILHIKNIGDIRFTPAQLGLTSITNIGYGISVNAVSGTVIAYLIVNDVVYKNFNIISNLTDVMVLPYDDSVANWWDYISGGVSMAVGAASVGAGIATANPVAIISGVGGVGGGFASIAQTEFEHATGSNAILGNPSQGMDTITRIESYVRIEYQDTVNEGIRSLYGKPSNRTRNISQLTGYVQTLNCKLLAKGLNESIVNEAEGATDNGIRIL